MQKRQSGKSTHRRGTEIAVTPTQMKMVAMASHLGGHHLKFNQYHLVDREATEIL
jgi:hypothetical protein